MEVNIKDISYMFCEFWEKGQGMNFDQQKQLWKELYQEPNKEIFQHFEFLFKMSDKNYNIDDNLEKCFQEYEKSYEKIKSLTNISDNINKVCKRCSEIFEINDIKLNFITIIGLCSANAFVTGFNGRTAFYFLEKMLKKEYIDILLAHEITHLFHFSQLVSENYESTLADSIFIDGLACFVSNYLYPGFTLSEYLCFDSDCQEWLSECNKQFNNIKSDIIHNIQSTDFVYFKKYFMGDNSIKDGIPTRIGYFIGYCIVEWLNKKYTLQEMISWQQDRIIKEVKGALTKIL
ncbi:DUF2268 domain-containing putative Zn-dependent protease [Oceanirhabdus seepicola]|uniref:DUF2268 domain-containing protein n=1 Tax=Oceanirhabdus seepicola TaxID=2828781 RepID=A0A9J6P1A2_9CLOT|nr:DUF2268 domain-containing putative Zn-dependent protease [Oceanirhabdus seepicola]MCM1989998.1 hypothetical protein [Oceanirhabdus seepicola]